MGRKLEWELSGKSDVPQKMAQAKASMEGLEGAANGLSKKFKEAFKDLALGFLAPMILVQKAIGFITDKIEQAKQKAEDARNFAKEEESKKYAPAGGREAIIQWMEKEKETESKRQGLDAASEGYRRFLESDVRGMEIVKEEVKKRPGFERAAEPFGGAAAMLSFEDEIRKRIDIIIAPDIAARKAAEDAKAAAKEGGAKAVADVGSNVIGVGISPQLDIANRQLVVQEDMANSLRQIIESDQARQGFRTTKQPDFGGAPARTLFPR